MTKEDQLQSIEKLRAKGELTEGEYLARKHKVMSEPEKKSALNPVFDSDRIGPRKKKRGKLMLVIVILAAAGGAYCYFHLVK